MNAALVGGDQSPIAAQFGEPEATRTDWRLSNGLPPADMLLIVGIGVVGRYAKFNTTNKVAVIPSTFETCTPKRIPVDPVQKVF